MKGLAEINAENDALETTARNALDWRDVENPEPEWAHAERVNLARAVLAMLPVIRAANEWHYHGPGQGHCEEEGCRCTEQVLREALDTPPHHAVRGWADGGGEMRVALVYTDDPPFVTCSRNDVCGDHCPECDGTGEYPIDLSDLATLAHNLTIAAGLCWTWRHGVGFGFWEGGCRLTDDDENPDWTPGCGKAAP